MDTPYPPIDRWLIPAQALQSTLTGVRSAGQRGNESGAFWLGTRSATANVLHVVLPGGPGVEERPWQWRVGSGIFDAISRWASVRGVVLLAIAHTHIGASVSLSEADRYQSVQVPGVLAVVIGRGGKERNPTRWGWYLYEDGDYRPLLPDEWRCRLKVSKGLPVDVWRAERDGVRPQGRSEQRQCTRDFN